MGKIGFNLDYGDDYEDTSRVSSWVYSVYFIVSTIDDKATGSGLTVNF